LPAKLVLFSTVPVLMGTTLGYLAAKGVTGTRVASVVFDVIAPSFGALANVPCGG
jgi:hypothetical protein